MEEVPQVAPTSSTTKAAIGLLSVAAIGLGKPDIIIIIVVFPTYSNALLPPFLTRCHWCFLQPSCFQFRTSIYKSPRSSTTSESVVSNAFE